MSEINLQASDANLRAAAERIGERAVLLILTRGKFQNSRAADLHVVEGEGGNRDGEAMLALSKRLLDSPALRAISAHERRVNATLRRAWALPSPFRFGVFSIPIGLVSQVNDYLRREMFVFDSLVADFLATYRADVDAAEAKLGPHFNRADYPSLEEMAGRFAMKFAFAAFSVPAVLEQFNADIVVAERAKAAAESMAAVRAMQLEMRAVAAELVGKVVERLTPDANGRPKMLVKGFGDNLREFLAVFNDRNAVAGDMDLANLMEQARRLSGNVDAAMLREDVNLRTAVATQFEQIGASLDAMIGDGAGKRRIRLSDPAEKGAA